MEALLGHHGYEFPGRLGITLARRAPLGCRSASAPPSVGARDQLELAGVGEIEEQERPRRNRWAWLLAQVFCADLDTCVRCGGPMRWIGAALRARFCDGAVAVAAPRVFMTIASEAAWCRPEPERCSGPQAARCATARLHDVEDDRVGRVRESEDVVDATIRRQRHSSRRSPAHRCRPDACPSPASLR